MLKDGGESRYVVSVNVVECLLAQMPTILLNDSQNQWNDSRNQWQHKAEGTELLTASQ